MSPRAVASMPATRQRLDYPRLDSVADTTRPRWLLSLGSTLRQPRRHPFVTCDHASLGRGLATWLTTAATITSSRVSLLDGAAAHLVPPRRTIWMATLLNRSEQPLGSAFHHHDAELPCSNIPCLADSFPPSSCPRHQLSLLVCGTSTPRAVDRTFTVSALHFDFSPSLPNNHHLVFLDNFYDKEAWLRSRRC
ncbi:hypothetical protein BDZ89DRAFT_633681 [Hymenopellis radicata]|nr:hypothetical protein BDZ89DRAFT_633681 [Hymenopellis radicata]